MYGKFFASTFTGSMFGAGADVFAVWGYVIANTVNSTVELNPDLLAAILGMTPERVKMAIEYLCSPDGRSRNHDEDGKRLMQQGPFQFHVVSHQHYRAIRNEDDRREYNRRKQAESRARRKELSNESTGMSLTVNDSQSLSTMSAHTEAEADTDKKQKPSRAKREGPTKTELAKSRHAEFKEAIAKYWAARNPDVEMTWGPAEGKNLEMWLRSSPHTTIEQFTAMLRNRYRSDVNHTERPSRWIGNITSYAAGAIDRYGKPLQSNGKGSDYPPGFFDDPPAQRTVKPAKPSLLDLANGGSNA